MTINDKIYTEIAKTTGLTQAKVEEAVRSQFLFLVERFKSREYEKPVRMQYLGLWSCKPGRLEKLREQGRI